MANVLTKIPTKIFDAFKNMSKGQKVRLFILIAIIIIILVLISVVLNQKNYVAIYRGLDSSEAGTVLAMLSDLGVDAKAEGTGTILVDETIADSVRMQLAAQGYPNSGLSYDIFQNASGLGVTDMERQIYYQFQLQENLRRTIMRMSKVEDAVVNIDLGEESSYVFSNKEQASTAAVLLELRAGQRLTADEAKSIAQLVANSVSGLDVENISITDSAMNQYSMKGDNEIESADAQMGLQASVSKRLKDQVINMLAPVFGEKNVMAEINVKLNFDKRIIESVEFAPPVNGTEGIVVSMKELVEAITNDAQGSVAGIDANGAASEYLAALGSDNNAAYYNVSREANYEINETKTLIEQAKGNIEELSVSVIINSEDADDDYSQEVIDLIATAIGVDRTLVTVAMLPFMPIEETDDLKESMQQQQQMLQKVQDAETLRLIIIVAAAVVILIILSSAIKMFVKSGRMAVAEGGFDYVVSDESVVSEPQRPSFDDIRIEDLDKTDNKLQILEDYIGKNPESVANLLRNWLNED